MTRTRQRKLASFRPVIEGLEDRNLLSTFTVDHLAPDDLVGSGLSGSLRYCMMNVTDGDAITFADGLTGTLDITRAPLPPISHSITITGPGADLLTVQRASTANFDIFQVAAGTVVEISGLTIANGNAAQGGGIYNAGTLTIDGSTFSGNSATGSGGGIYNAGTLTVSGSTFSRNSVSNSIPTGANGGGIYNASGRSAAVSGSTFSGNFTNGFGGTGSGGGIYSAGMLTVSDSVFSGNSFSGSGGGIANRGGTLTVSGSTFSGNTPLGPAPTSGGGIYNDGPPVTSGRMTVSGSTFSGNSASSQGGGIYCSSSSGMVSGSTFSSNSAGSKGGGIYSAGTLSVSNSTLSGNSATGPSGQGGGIYSDSGTLSVSNSTLSGNSATGSVMTSHGGGGIYSYGTLDLTSCTLAGNSTSGNGGGLYVAGTARTRNTILAGNSAARGPDLYGNLGSQMGMGYNLIQTPDMYGSGFDFTDWLGLDPLLDPSGLQDNGGPTQTIALLPGSPALDAGDPAQLGVPDQRGVIRSGGVNIGAYQASATAFLVAAPDTVEAGAPFDVTVTAVDPFGQLAVGYTGTATFSSTDPDPGVVLPADYTFQLSDAGSVTLTAGVALITSGPQMIAATDTADNTITGGASVTVAGAAPGPGSRHREQPPLGYHSMTRAEAARRLEASVWPPTPGWQGARVLLAEWPDGPGDLEV